MGVERSDSKWRKEAPESGNIPGTTEKAAASWYGDTRHSLPKWWCFEWSVISVKWELGWWLSSWEVCSVQEFWAAVLTFRTIQKNRRMWMHVGCWKPKEEGWKWGLENVCSKGDEKEEPSYKRSLRGHGNSRRKGFQEKSDKLCWLLGRGTGRRKAQFTIDKF